MSSQDETLDRVESELKPGFFMIKNVVIESFDLSIGSFWLYACLIKYTFNKKTCFPSVRTLAGLARAGPKESGVSEQAIRNWTDELVQKKLIRVSEQLGHGKTYTILEINSLVTPQPGLTGQPSFADPSTDVCQTPQPGLTLIRRIEEKKEEEDLKFVSPQAGEAISNPTSNFSFSQYVKSYPDFAGSRPLKTKNQIKKAENDWGKLTHEDQQRVVSALFDWEKSGKWSGDQSTYIPSMSTFISDGAYWRTPPKETNHVRECGIVHNLFLDIAGKSESLCELNTHRREMLSERWEEAMRKAQDHTEENALEVIRAAIEARCEAHVKGGRGRLTLESVFESTETFERWIEAAMEKQ